MIQTYKRASNCAGTYTRGLYGNPGRDRVTGKKEGLKVMVGAGILIACRRGGEGARGQGEGIIGSL